MHDITRINRVQSYKVITEARATEIVATFDLDPTHHNHYFLVSSRVAHDEPRPLREYREYLKYELRDTPIVVLALQSTETKVIKKKKDKETEEETA